MESKQAIKFRILLFWVDLALWSLAYGFGIWTRYKIDIFHDPIFSKFSSHDFGLLAVLTYLSFLLSSNVMGQHPQIFYGRYLSYMGSTIKVIVMAVLISMALAYMFFTLVSSRVLVASTFLYLWVLLQFKFWCWRGMCQYQEHWIRHQQSLIIYKNEEFLFKTKASIKNSAWMGLSIAAEIKEPSIELIHLLDSRAIDLVLIESSKLNSEDLLRTIHECEIRGLEIWHHSESLVVNIGTSVSLGPMRFLVQGQRHDLSTFFLLKGILDKLLTFLLCIGLLPLLLIMAALIKLSSPGPIIYRQKRAGYRAKPFVLYKFRTMAEDAEKRQHELIASNEMPQPAFKMHNDPRVTPVGRLLRRFSLDELPQLWNVLKGDMSLVGPRPMAIDEASQVTAWRRRRFSMQPGITCLWQVGRHNQITSFDEWVNMDLEYIDKWNLWLDTKILLKTIWVVLKAKGY